MHSYFNFYNEILPIKKHMRNTGQTRVVKWAA